MKPINKIQTDEIPNGRQPRILLFDIETSPNLSYVWGQYEQNVLSHVQERQLISFAWKWAGQKRVHVKSLPDYKGYDPAKPDDKELARDLWKLFDEADILIAHNGNAFDIKVANTRFIAHGFNPPSHYRTIDTLSIAKRSFKFNSNKLDDLGRFLKVGRKVTHTGFSLWLGCMSGDLKSWKLMCKYNKQDVALLELVYQKLRAWSPNHPDVMVYTSREHGCSCCGSKHLQRRGLKYTNTQMYWRYECQTCGAWTTGARVMKPALSTVNEEGRSRKKDKKADADQ